MAHAPTYPKKLFYKIQEVANIIGVESYVLRYWETKFPMLSPEKDANDQRRYRQKDIELLLRIRELLHVEKYTIAGAVEKIKEDPTGKSGTKPNVPAIEPIAEAEAAKPQPADNNGVIDLFPGEFPENADSDEDAFDAETTGMNEEQMEALRKVREELGLLKRELENWRDELG